MKKLFIPEWYTENLHSTDWKAVKELGLKLVFLDIDNTLEPDGSYQPGPETIDLVREIQDNGLAVCVLSNAKPGRAAVFCEPLQVPYLGLAAKPFTHKLTAYLKEHGFKAENCLMIGDQVFTDLLCGKWSGCRTLMVKSLGGEESFYVKAKRILERLLVKLGLDPAKAPQIPQKS